MPCRSPNIVQFYGASAAPDSVMLVTEVGSCMRAAVLLSGVDASPASPASLLSWLQVNRGSQWLNHHIS